MIVFDFRINENELTEDKNIGIRYADPAVLYQTYFVMPVRLNINGLEVFEITQSNKPTQEEFWLEMPLIQIAVAMVDLIRQVSEENKTIKYVLPEVGAYLRLKSDDGIIQVSSTLNSFTAITTCQDFMIAVKDFQQKVRQELQRVAPEVLERPDWDSWFTND